MASAKLKKQLARMGKVVLLFGVACYFTSCVMDANTGVDTRKRLKADGGIVGPVKVEAANTVISVDVQQQIDDGPGSTFKRWSFITASLLDDDKKYLSGFGGSLWHEAGYDDGYWEQEDTDFSTKLTIPNPGSYYLRFKTEANVPSTELSKISVEVEGRLGSSLPFHVVSLFALVVGAGMWLFGVAETA